MAKKTKKRKSPEKRGVPQEGMRKIIVQIVVIILVLAVGTAGSYALLFSSDLFSVHDIKVYGGYENKAVLDAVRISYLKKNIFEINIENMKEFLMQQDHRIKDLVSKRELPDVIILDVVPRLPMAILVGMGQMIVDREGVVISKKINEAVLPKIHGVNMLFRFPAVGEKIKDAKLGTALQILTLLKKEGFPLNTIAEITVSQNVTFVFARGPEVKLGNGEFSEKIKLLKKAFDSPDIEPGNIDYIDLRFQGIVISPKK